MPDFSKLYKKSSGQAKRPSALPVSQKDDYPGIISRFEMIEATPDAQGRPRDYETIIRFHVNLTDWPEGVPEEDRLEDDGDGGTRPINLQRRQLRRDFYDNALWRLDEFLASCGIELGAGYEEVIPQAVGAEVLVEVQQYMNQRTGEVGNQIGRLAGRHAAQQRAA